MTAKELAHLILTLPEDIQNRPVMYEYDDVYDDDLRLVRRNIHGLEPQNISVWDGNPQHFSTSRAVLMLTGKE